jgi:DNA polymerase III delta prime subunit
MLIKKYIPHTFSKSKINSDVITKLKQISKNTFMNLIFHGPNGTGKYILSLLLLRELFGKSVYNKNIYKEVVNMYYSSVHYEIVLSKNSNKSSDLKEIIIDISGSQNILSDFNNIIIIKNAKYLNSDILHTIKYLIENNYPIFFILLYENISNIPKSIHNLFIKIRVPKINNMECFSLFKSIIVKEKINISDLELAKLLDTNQNNITKLFLIIENINNNKQVIGYVDQKIEEILELVYTKKISNILKIRDKLYELCAKNIEKKYILKYCLSKVLNKIQLKEKKKELVKLACDLEHKCIESYKEIIHLEYFIIALIGFV